MLRSQNELWTTVAISFKPEKTMLLLFITSVSLLVYMTLFNSLARLCITKQIRVKSITRADSTHRTQLLKLELFICNFLLFSCPYK